MSWHSTALEHLRETHRKGKLHREMAPDSEWSTDGDAHRNQGTGDAAEDSNLHIAGPGDCVKDSWDSEHEPHLRRYHSHEPESSEACVGSRGTELICLKDCSCPNCQSLHGSC